MRRVVMIVGVVVLFGTVCSLPRAVLGFADCNRNGSPDVDDIDSGRSADCNLNRTPDECELSVPAFGLRHAIAVPGTPERIASADFDGDKRPDLVIAFPRDGDAPATLQLLRARDSAVSYSPAVVLSGISVPFDLHATDVDSDSIPDILMAGPDGVQFLRNRGDATFTPPTHLNTSAAAGAVLTADLDDDGVSDLVYTEPARNRLGIRLGSGSGDFAPVGYVEVAPGPSRLALGDFNADGHLDLAVGCSDAAEVIVLLATGGGDFTPGEATALSSSAAHLEAIDLDGDETIDLFAVTPTAVYVFENGSKKDGNAQFSSPRSLAGNNGGAHAFDFDGDGDTDIALLPGGTLELRILINTGSGRFEPAIRLATESSADAIFSADYDQSGTADLLISARNMLTFFWNARPDTYSLSRETLAVTRRPHGGILADLNGDERPDVVLSSGHNRSVTVHFSLGDGTIGPEVKYMRENAGHLNSITAGDVDGDGHIDVVTADKELNRFSVFLNEGDGTLEDPSHYPAGRGAFHLTAADLDGDGHVDLISANEDGANVTLAFNQGDGTFAEQRDVRVGRRPVFVSAGDLDGDGHPELAVANKTTRSLSILYNHGRGRFERSVEYPVLEQCLSARPVDLDRDGDLDLITANGTEDVVGIFWNDGEGEFEQARVSAPRPPQDVLARDINNDGELDLIVLHKASSAVSILIGYGGGAFGSGSLFPVGDLPRVLLAGDLDLDGDVDLVAANRISQNVTVFQNERSNPLAALALSEVCSERDFQRLAAAPPGTPHTVDYAAALQSDSTSELAFPNGYLLDGPATFLIATHPEQFGTLAPADVDHLQAHRATRTFYLGEIERLPNRVDADENPLRYGFRVRAANTVEDLLDRAETEALHTRLSARFALAPLAYIPSGALAERVASSWVAPSFPILYDGPPLPATPPFQRGDANADGRINIADASYILGFLFDLGPSTSCPKAADIDDSGDLVITDPVALLSFLFLGQTPPAAPYLECGQDTTFDAVVCEQHGPCSITEAAAGEETTREESR